jgi:NTE family protein
VGALNGWAIAGGCDPGDLVEQWLDPGVADVMRLRWPWPPWTGIFRQQALASRVERLYADYRPRIPFAAAVTEVPRLRLRLVRDGEIRPRHLLAACSLPCGYPAIRIDGRRLADGGFLSVLPLWAAAQMGAERAIAVHVLPVMPSRLIRWGVGIVRTLAGPPPAASTLEVRTIAMGGGPPRLRDCFVWERGRIESLIEQGMRDARAARLFDG